MRVAQRIDYAMRAVTALAALPENRMMPAGELADRLGLPRRFVEQQVTVLVRHGIVRSRRGPGGGVALNRLAGQITAYEVIVAVQGDLLDVPRVSASAVSEMWGSAAESLERHFKGIDLEELAVRQRELDEMNGFMYHI
ncbi:MAG: Rrf2 family transcriptional regulator [Clostridiales bacterium]|nr:Rrf2 family transcriptional regulator [Clostridiales bacterium]